MHYSCVHSSFAIILKSVALLLLSYNRCIVNINVLWLLLRVPCIGLQCVIVVFPDHTHFLCYQSAVIPIIGANFAFYYIPIRSNETVSKLIADSAMYMFLCIYAKDPDKQNL